MMIIVLRILGWAGLLLSLFNGSIKIFGEDAAVARYAGADRNLDVNFTIAAFCLIFLALAAILSQLKGR